AERRVDASASLGGALVHVLAELRLSAVGVRSDDADAVLRRAEAGRFARGPLRAVVVRRDDALAVLGRALAGGAAGRCHLAVGVRLRHVPPFFLVGTALLLGATSGARGIRVRGLRPAVLLLGVYGLFAYHFCLFLALRLAPPIEANLINYLWPLLIVVLSPV